MYILDWIFSLILGDDQPDDDDQGDDLLEEEVEMDDNSLEKLEDNDLDGELDERGEEFGILEPPGIDGYDSDNLGQIYPPSGIQTTTWELEQFDPDSVDPDTIIGDPLSDMETWHQQQRGDTCAIASQEFILDQLTYCNLSEIELSREAFYNGWYTPDVGTPSICMGNLLEAHGIQVEQKYGCTLEELSEKLEQHEKVLVGLDADEIWYPGGLDDDNFLYNYMGIPGQDDNHAVQVIGINCADPANPKVILNDPVHPCGRDLMVPANEFLDAWADSNCFMVPTTKQRRL